nr:hypothetical protein [uncultured Rhodoferax sp.]
MLNNTIFPAEWPDHLSNEATITPLNVTPPTGRDLLDLPALGPERFEQFCWWLLQKEGKTLHGCKRLGGTGYEQGGIDIFASEAHDPERLIVFECKSGKGFKSGDLKDAVNKFIEGEWIARSDTFVLMLAIVSLEGPLGKTWVEQKNRLREKGIVADVWTAHELTERAQAHPDILSKFFPTYDIPYFGNQWMQRTAFISELQRGIFDPRKHVAEWAQKLASYSSMSDSEKVSNVNDINGLEITRIGNNLTYKSLWFTLNVILPGPGAQHLATMMSLHQPDMQGVSIGLPHDWMMSRMLYATGAPATHEYRGFIVGPSWNSDKDQVIDLGSCRLTMQDQGVRLLAKAADALTAEFHGILINREQGWAARDFVFVNRGGQKVALAILREDVWREVLRFARAHDVDTGDTTWHMFDATHYLFRVVTADPARHANRFDNGIHGSFEAVHIPNLSRSGEVVMLWQPPSDEYETAVSPRGWWPCEYAYQWLNRELLPQVKDWIFQREFGNGWKRLFRSVQARRFADLLEVVVFARDIREPGLQHVENTAEGLLAKIGALQRFFSKSRTPSLYLRQRDVETLFLAAAQVAGVKCGNVNYVRGSLSLKDDPNNHAELANSIRRHVQSGKVVASSVVVDYALRAILELLGPAGDTLPPKDKQFLQDALLPFIRQHDEYKLLQRHYGSHPS